MLAKLKKLRPFFTYDWFEESSSFSFNFQISLTSKCWSVMICWSVPKLRDGLIDMGIHEHQEDHESN